jgi:hypothetical protein
MAGEHGKVKLLTSWLRTKEIKDPKIPLEDMPPMT